jgi:hypothetical protein
MTVTRILIGGDGMNQNITSDAEQKTRMVTIADVQKEYLPGSYKKIKSFCLTYLSFMKIGRTYYFNRTELEKIISKSKQLEYELKY